MLHIARSAGWPIIYYKLFITYYLKALVLLLREPCRLRCLHTS